MKENNLLHDLSRKLIHLSGNDFINKKLSGHGKCRIFNVCDEIPQFVLNRLQSGKKFKIKGLDEYDESHSDELKEEFQLGWKKKLKDSHLAEEDMNEIEIREYKDELRTELGMKPSDELLIDKKVDLPWLDSGESGLGKHEDEFLQTDIPLESLNQVISKMEKERLSFQREKGLQVLYIAFGFLEWTSINAALKKEKIYNSPLLLMEISIEQSNQTYKIVGEGDLFPNPDLPHALEAETKDELPCISEHLNSKKGFSLNGYLDEFKKRFNEIPNWNIRNRIAVGIFKSRGIPVSEVRSEGYRQERITETEKILIGTSSIPSKVDPSNVDDNATRTLVPAFALPVDASQHATILEVAKGNNLVIEGPPGTGKSQTIVNLICNSIHQGKSVLFLAQKLAALEVVKNRLEHCGVGRKCIAIHSDYTSRKLFFGELKGKLDQSPHLTSSMEFEEVCKKRDQVIDQLNSHAKTLGRGFSAKDASDSLTVQRILTTHILLKEKIIGEEPLPLNLGKDYLLSDLSEDLRKSEELSDRANALAPGTKDLLAYFKFSKLPDPFEVDEISQKIQKALSNLRELSEQELKQDLGFFIEKENSWHVILKAKQDFDASISNLSSVFDSLQDPLVEEFLKYSKSMGRTSNWLWKLWSTRLTWTKAYSAREWLEEFFRNDEEELTFKTLIEKSSNIRKTILNFRRSKKILERSAKQDLSFDDIENSHLKASKVKDYVQRSFQLLEQLDSVPEGNLVEDYLSMIQSLDMPSKDFFNICFINHEILEFENRLGCGNWLRQSILEGLKITERLEAHIFQSLAKEIASKNKRIFLFDRNKMAALREQLVDLEKDASKKFCDKLARENPDPEKVPTTNEKRVRDKTGLSLLKHVSSKPTARVTVRELCTRAADALQCYSPCFLMTPSSVADYLPKDLTFDLLIIDEASQMLTEEAIGSILRSKQIVVVGDQKQMPPTKYMQSTLHEVAVDEEKNESILDKATLAFGHYSRLNYHYRSADETLIHFSNHEFYDNELLTPPSHGGDENLGLKFENADGVYHAGKGMNSNSRNPNPIEADKLVELIIEEIKQRPDFSLGIAVMNLRQAERVDEIFRKRIDKGIKDYLNKWRETPEYFFIKNLENVQGDERDTMVIATVYGKTEEGKTYQRFGPINLDKGENRINVLVTRAKKRVVVCSSIDPQEITNKSQGAQVFKRYLSYAKTGEIANPQSIESGLEQKKDLSISWENWFASKLRNDGFDVDLNVGRSAWKIDLAIKHPSKKNSYVCGIELDGAVKLRKSARDREILNQSVLEAKGWKILRVQTIDFFIDAESEYNELKKKISEIVEKSDAEVEKTKQKEIIKVEEKKEFIESTVSRSSVISF